MDLDQSLDAMIKSAPKKGPKGVGGGGKKKAKPVKGNGGTPGKKLGGMGVKTKVIAKPRRGPKANAMAVDAWTHDKFRPAQGQGQAQGGSAKLIISNLHPNVTNQDIKELFAQVGQVKSAGLNFDQNGRSKGTAEVVLARRQDATQAIKTYNGVKLDGRPLKIELVGGVGGPGGVTLSSGVTVTGVRGRGGGGVGNSGVGNSGARKVVVKVVPRPGTAKGPRSKGPGAGGGATGGGAPPAKKGRERKKKGPKPEKAAAPTQEQLDAQLDSYKGAAAMEA